MELYFKNIEEKINQEIKIIWKNKEVLTPLENYYNELVEKKEKGELIEKKDNNYYVKMRKNREKIKNSFKLRKITIGDVLEFNYVYKSAVLSFSGICIAIKKTGYIVPDVSIILRNIIITTGLEIVLSYFYNRAYKMRFLDYKRKFYTYNKTKIYFIRKRINRESRVK